MSESPAIDLENKLAATDYPILELIRARWSPRAFADRPIAEQDLMSLFEAARWAASSGNNQPWRFVYAHKGTSGFDTILATLASGNQEWAKSAAVLMIVVAKETRASGKPNGHAWYDTGAAMATLSLQALAQDIYVHQMGGFDAEAANEALNVPADHGAVAAVALGYLGSPEQLGERNREREGAPRERMALTDIAIRDAFAD